MQHQLAFREDRTFTIVQFTDLHWENGGDEDQQTRRLMEEVLDAEHPDLVVFTGDVIYTGNGASGEPVCEQPHQAFRDAVHTAESRGIPWAVVFGNHDTETTITRDELMHTVLEHPHTVTKRGPEEINGVGNYTLSISGSDGQTAAALYFFDSGDRSPLPIQGYDWIRSNQIDWYREESRKIQSSIGAQAYPSLAFFHIPLPEYKQVWENGTCYGNKFENVCCSPVNSGLFTAMVEMGDVIGTFCGHDHVNDYWGELHGVRLCYGRATGYNTYGKEGFPRGARMIRLREGQRSFESWLRLADGTVIKDQPEHNPNV
ncbi:metallophosphoesterase family protein [Paenibacillus sp. Soil724D2]|uniref:metallophosphoesterase family protein n=1 Tax=Paenibacillus sp. (strain Soil724D2) TaxID=1736392 RepID=UPI000714A074|nr:metallophosphoesterase family protein [Paenibacillus sp. Soil724D2]KRE50147.1 metallophosphoesterase [Paenibacillus sp. Soil724D2]